MDVEKIERYLYGQMEPSEEETFESQMRKWPSQEDDVRTMAYIIHCINQVNQERENDRIDRIRNSSHSDRKRYVAAVAAFFLAVMVVTGSVATGIYFLMNEDKEEKTQTLPDDYYAPKKVENSLKQQDLKNDPEPSPDNEGQEKGKVTSDRSGETVQSHKVTADKTVQQEVTVQKQESSGEKVDAKQPNEASKQEQKELRPKLLPPNYEITDVKIQKRNGLLTCSFNMRNMVEDATIRIHTPRAIDIYNKHYSKLYCEINKENKPEKWEKGKYYPIVISINLLNEDVVFKQISFSFQSKGKFVQTNSMSIEFE